MTPDPITPDAVEPIAKWCKVLAALFGSLTVILGSVIGAVNYLVDYRLQDLRDSLEEEMAETAQAVVDDDVEWQDRRIELLERRLERLESP